jgi:hypothetical protein
VGHHRDLAASSAGDLPVIEGVELEPAALRVRDGAMPLADWESALQTLGPIERGSAWWLGDLLVFGGKRYGETYGAAARATGLNPGTLRNLASVARAVPAENRESSLSWRAHRTVAPLTHEEQRRWLKRAAKHEWTSDELARELRRKRMDASDSKWPDPETEPNAQPAHRCPNCGFEWNGDPRPEEK